MKNKIKGSVKMTISSNST